MDMQELIRKTGIVPVVVLDDAKDAEPLAEALIRGGLPCAEVTFRTAAAEEPGRAAVLHDRFGHAPAGIDHADQGSARRPVL